MYRGGLKTVKQMRFRIAYNDTIRANILSMEGKVLATVYDSGFKTIKQVEQTLINKIPYFSGKEVQISIFNIDKDIYKRYNVKVNN